MSEKISHLIYNEEFYTKSLKEFGISAKGMHWHNKSTQYTRFKILTSFIKDIKESSILDVGCGCAEYYNYLIIHKNLPYKYIGIDCFNKMVDISKKRFPNIEFQIKDTLNTNLIYSDYYVSSGSMSLLDGMDVLLSIENCYKFSNKAFIFNFLKEEGLSGLTQNQIIMFCKSLCNNVLICDNYLENDFTISMCKN